MKSRVALVAILCLGFLVTSGAQVIKWGADKTVRLNIPHAPQFGLTVKRVAFGQPGGACASEATELVDRMILPDFQQNQMDVIEREALNQIMAEHNFNQSTYADGASAVRLGKILGPSALIIVNVNGCSHEQLPLYQDQNNFNGTMTRTLISKTRYSLEGSIRIVDLTTGQVIGSHNFQGKPEKQNTSTTGQPEFPPVDEVKDDALQEVKSEIHAMFFPSDEIVQVIFYDDKDCGLKQSYEALKNGDRDGALRIADSNLEQCQAGHKKDKSLARAFYDDALLHCLHGDYDKSKGLFTEAMDGKGAEAVGSTSAGCNRARESIAALNGYQARLAQIPTPAPIGTGGDKGPAPEPRASGPSTSVGSTSADASHAPFSVEDRLKKLDALYKKGLINKKEYDQKRAEILNQI